MSYISSKSEYSIKHILSPDWIFAKYVSDNEEYIELLIEYNESISFENDDKIVFSIKSKNSNLVFNTVILDIDFPTYDKITIRIKKPFERRNYSRYNVSLNSVVFNDSYSEKCLTVDISEKGAKILSDLELPLKSLIELNISIGDSEFISIKGSIVYKQMNTTYNNKYKNIYGIKLVDISKQNKILLDDFILSLTS